MRIKSVQAEHHIAAPVEVVWEILTRLDEYPLWNPFTPEIHGRLEPGSVLQLKVHLGRVTLRVKERVVSVVPNKEIVWQAWDFYHHLHLSTGGRTQRLAPHPDGGTRYSQVETFHGPLSPLTVLALSESVRRGMVAVGDALKVRAEARVASGSKAGGRPPE